MKRRDFLQRSLVTGPALAAGGSLLSACQGHSNQVQAQLPPPYHFGLAEVSIDELQRRQEAGGLSALILTEAYLERIYELNDALQAVININPDATKIAIALDQERAESGPRGPLHGIPILLKDNIDTQDPMPTTAGSIALAENYARRDAFLVAQLRKAGAVILGKTNLSEWANFRSPRSSSGWSSQGGQTRNPYALDCSPCGSSSGSGVAVAANFCSVAIGTETDGSIICPSALCGVVGIKPTLGLISRTGIIPIAHSQDTAGPMARTVRDAAILLSALTGVDPEDPATANQRAEADYTAFLDENSLGGARIGVMRSSFGVHEKLDAAIENALEVLRKAGATLIDLERVTPADEPYKGSEFEVLLYEFKNDLNAYLAQTDAKVPIKNLQELIDFNEAQREQAMPYFEQEILRMAVEKGPLTDRAYSEALAKSKRLTQAEGLDAVMDQHQLDAIVGPSDAPAWKIDLVNGDHYIMGGKASYSPAAVAGYPNITVPAGYVHDLPVGISFMGRAYSEPRLLGLAYAYEQLSRHRSAPDFTLIKTRR